MRVFMAPLSGGDKFLRTLVFPFELYETIEITPSPSDKKSLILSESPNIPTISLSNSALSISVPFLV